MPTPIGWGLMGRTPGRGAMKAGGGLLPFTDNFSTDGALGPRWTGSTWTVSSGVAVNTPTETPLAVTNGDMEANSTWGALATPVSQAQSDEQAHGGTYSWKVVSDGVTDGTTQTILTYLNNTWYVTRAWLYVTVGSADHSVNNTVGQVGSAIVTNTSTWTQVYVTGRTSSTARVFNLKARTAVSTFYADDASAAKLTLSSLFATVETGKADVSVQAAATIPTGALAGVVACLDSAANPANFLIAYHNGTNLLLEKCVAGTYTTLVNTAATYGAGRVIKIIKNGTTVQVYYNGVQVGTDQTVSDAGIISNTKHGLFSTHSACSLDAFTVTT